MIALQRLGRLILAAGYLLLIGIVPALPQAALLPNAKQTFLDDNGNPLTGGKVYSYVPGTTVPKTTWTDSNQTTPNANPVTLDAAGRAVIYGQGSYQQRVTKSNGDQVWSAPTTAWNSSEPSGAGGTDTAPVGTIVVYSGLTSPTNWQFTYGQQLNRVEFSGLYDTITIADTSVSCVSGSAVLSGWDSTAQMRLGAPVEASCLPTGTTVRTIVSATQITVSNTATSTTTITARVFPWGNGDGVDTFNVPDLRGRAPVGADVMGGTSAGRLSITTTITTTSGQPIATVASGTGVYVGMTVVSANVPVGATVTQIVGNFVTLSANATATASGTAVTFYAFATASAIGSVGGSQSHVLAQDELSQAIGAASVSDPGHTHSDQAFTANGDVDNPNAGHWLAAGTNIYRAGTPDTVLGVTSTSVTGLGVTITNNLLITSTLSTTTGSPTATVGSAAGLFIGMTILCSPSPYKCGAAAGATITAISGTTLTMSANATDTLSTRVVGFTYPAGGNAHSIMSPTALVNYIIKVKANSSGAGGVVSIGGMFGDILCGAGIDCTNNTISSAATPSLPTNQIYVGNATNLPAAVPMTGDCSIVSSGAITCTASTPVTLLVDDASTNPIGISSDVTLIVINKTTPSSTSFLLGTVATRNNKPVEIYDFAGTGGDITITPDGTEKIMGVGTWVVTSGGTVGTGGAIKLTPSTIVNGWLAR